MTILAPDISGYRPRLDPQGLGPETSVLVSALGVFVAFYLLQQARIHRVELAHHLIGKR